MIVTKKLRASLGLGEPLGPVAVARGGAAGEVAADAHDFSAGRIDEDVLQIGRSRVLQEIGRDDRDGRSYVLELRVEARAGQR